MDRGEITREVCHGTGHHRSTNRRSDWRACSLGLVRLLSAGRNDQVRVNGLTLSEPFNQLARIHEPERKT